MVAHVLVPIARKVTSHHQRLEVLLCITSLGLDVQSRFRDPDLGRNRNAAELAAGVDELVVLGDFCATKKYSLQSSIQHIGNFFCGKTNTEIGEKDIYSQQP